ncbi:HAD family hydrolase [Legionella cardiaca]|uniref:HAD-IIIA family hydrolase n=1 Tax=Legionella cardiaca TaxID=1071983 RepID=A0ABY8ANT5_9GAMM|nr:HAD-IIIA family hydrolase [Legionella cardiaca]WED42315.1 HAD-IIIA family hydrolase [Legionella cardiaca]
MGKPYRLVVFDWEGTLGDTLGQIFNSVAIEARRLQFGEIDKQLARQSVDLGLVKALRKIFPDLSEEQHQQLLHAVQHSLIARTTEVFLIPGAKDFISRLHNAGIDIAIATNKGQQSLQRTLHISGLDTLFKVTRSAGQTAPKPSTQMLEEIIDTFGLTTDETLMIGDSITDIEMAKNLGVDAIGVDFYHQQHNALLAAGAMAVFDDYQHLADYLCLPKEGELK